MTHSRKDCRNGQRCEPQTLQESLYCLLHHSRITLPAIAEAIGKRPGYLSDAANPDCETVHFQAGSLVPAMLAADNFVPLEFLARQCNAVVVFLPKTDVDSDDLRRGFMATAKELGDVASEIDRALTGDDAIDADEFTRIDRQIAEFIAAGAALRQALLKKAGKA